MYIYTLSISILVCKCFGDQLIFDNIEQMKFALGSSFHDFQGKLNERKKIYIFLDEFVCENQFWWKT